MRRAAFHFGPFDPLGATSIELPFHVPDAVSRSFHIARQDVFTKAKDVNTLG